MGQMKLKYVPAKVCLIENGKNKCYRYSEPPLINESDSQLQPFLENVKKKYANQPRAQLMLSEQQLMRFDKFLDGEDNNSKVLLKTF